MNIVSLAPSNTEILFELGVGDQIVATTSLCDRPKQALEKPSIGGWTNPKISRLHEFNPDIVIASDDLQDEAVEKIQEEGYPVLQVKPHSLEEVYKSIIKIGEAVNREKEAKNMVQEIKKELSKIELDQNVRIYCEEWMDPPMVSGNWIPDIIEEIGGSYFVEDGRSREFDFDELERFDPEYIFMNICGAGENLRTEQLTQRDDWEKITAVENEQVHVIDDNLLNRPSHRLVKGAKKIANKING